MAAIPGQVQRRIFTEIEISALTLEQRRRIGELAVERIRARCAAGLDENGSAFRYAPDSEFAGNNLTLSGDMLTMLDVVSVTDGIVVGYIDMEAQETLQAENHQNAVTYSPQYRKPFLNLSRSEKDLIIARVQQEVPTVEAPQQFIDNFISRLFASQGE